MGCQSTQGRRGAGAEAVPPGLVGAVGFLLAVLALLPAFRPAFADDASIGRDAEGVFPVHSSDVTMLEESVEIRLSSPYPDSWPIYSQVTCQFVFRNESGSSVDVEMAFPASVREDEFTERGDTRIHDFRASVDGQELDVSLEPASSGPEDAPPEYDWWYVFTVPFAPGETRTVCNAYWVKNLTNSIGQVRLAYVLRTGRYWKGPIGRATVTVHLGPVRPYQIMSLVPNRWVFSPDGRTTTWTREDFEPSYDLVVWYNLRDWEPGFQSYLNPEALERLRRRKAWFEHLVGSGVRTQEVLRELYRAAVQSGDGVQANLLRSLLPSGTIADGPPACGAEAVADNGTRVVVHYSDPDGDIVAMEVRVTHEFQGATVVDYEGREVYLAERWDPLTFQSGTYTGSWACYVGVGAGNYQVEVRLEDSVGHIFAGTFTVRPGAGGDRADQGTADGQTPKTAAVVHWVASGAMAGLCFGALLWYLTAGARRRKGHRTSSQ